MSGGAWQFQFPGFHLRPTPSSAPAVTPAAPVPPPSALLHLRQRSTGRPEELSEERSVLEGIVEASGASEADLSATGLFARLYATADHLVTQIIAQHSAQSSAGGPEESDVDRSGREARESFLAGRGGVPGALRSAARDAHGSSASLASPFNALDDESDESDGEGDEDEGEGEEEGGGEVDGGVGEAMDTSAAPAKPAESDDLLLRRLAATLRLIAALLKPTGEAVGAVEVPRGVASQALGPVGAVILALAQHPSLSPLLALPTLDIALALLEVAREVFVASAVAGKSGASGRAAGLWWAAVKAKAPAGSHKKKTKQTKPQAEVVWAESHPVGLDLLEATLTLAQDGRGPTRRAALAGLAEFFRSALPAPADPSVTPLQVQLGEQVRKKVLKKIKVSLAKSAQSALSAARALRGLSLARTVIPFLPVEQLEELAKHLLALPALGVTELTAATHATVAAIFAALQAHALPSPPAQPSPASNLSLLLFNAEMDLAPNASDAALAGPFLRALADGARALAAHQPGMFIKKLPKVLLRLGGHLTSAVVAVREATAVCAGRLFAAAFGRVEKSSGRSSGSSHRSDRADSGAVAGTVSDFYAQREQKFLLTALLASPAADPSPAAAKSASPSDGEANVVEESVRQVAVVLGKFLRAGYSHAWQTSTRAAEAFFAVLTECQAQIDSSLAAGAQSAGLGLPRAMVHSLLFAQRLRPVQASLAALTLPLLHALVAIRNGAEASVEAVEDSDESDSDDEGQGRGGANRRSASDVLSSYRHTQQKRRGRSNTTLGSEPQLSTAQALRRGVEAALAAALNCVGPQHFLTALPFTVALYRPPSASTGPSVVSFAPVEGSTETMNVWVLGFVRAHLARGGFLQTWKDSLLPIAQTLATNASLAAQHQAPGNKALLHSVAVQIWALLPALALAPVDTATSLSGVVTVVKAILTAQGEEMALRLYAASALHALASSLLDLRRTLAGEKQGCSGVGGEDSSDEEMADGGAHEAASSGEDEEDAPDSSSLTFSARAKATGQMAAELEQSEAKRVEFGLARTEEALAALRAVADQLLPPLFTLYVSPHTLNSPDLTPAMVNSSRTILLPAISALFNSADPAVVNKFFKTVVSKLLRPDKSAGAAPPEALTELLVAFVPHLEPANVGYLYKTIAPHLSSDSGSVLSKKSWRVLRELAGKQTEAFLRPQWPAVVATLSHCIAAATPFAVSHLAIVTSLARHMGESDLIAWLSAQPSAQAPSASASAVVTPLPAIIFALRDGAARTRKAARTAFTTVAERLAQGSGRAGLRGLVELLIAATASQSDKIIAATLDAFALLIQRHAKDLEALESEARSVGQVGPVGNLLKTATLLLDWQTLEVRLASLYLLAILVTPLNHLVVSAEAKEALFPLLGAALSALFAWPEALKTKCRQELRAYFERLLRRFGFDTVSGLTPTAHRKYVVNLRKLLDRQKRKKQNPDATATVDPKASAKARKHSKAKGAFQTEDDLMDSDDEDGPAKARGAKGGAKGSAGVWLETKGDELLDFTDPRVASRILSVNPSRAPASNRPTAAPFAMSEDGKLIIGEEDSDDEKKLSRDANEMDIDGGEGLPPTTLSLRHKKRVRVEDNDDDSDEEGPSQSKSKASGPGAKRQKNSEEKYSHRAQPNKTKGDAKPKKSGGSRLEPYSYIPLNPKFLNKRRRATAHKQFAGVATHKPKRG